MSQNPKKFLKASEAPLRAKASNYPPEFAKRFEGRDKRPLGDLFGIQKFGVNLTTLHPGAESSLFHKHTKQEEFIYILAGEATLVLESGEYTLQAGDCAGFSPQGSAHKLRNKSNTDVIYLEIGDRPTDDQASYPHDDLQAVMGSDGKWKYQRKNGTPIE